MAAAYEHRTPAAYDDVLDHVAWVTAAADLDRIRDLYESDDDLRVPTGLLSG